LASGIIFPVDLEKFQLARLVFVGLAKEKKKEVKAMSKKIIIVLLAFGMASVANAAVIDVVTLGTGSMGGTGKSTDPLSADETIEIAIVLNYNQYSPVWTSYDGYLLSRMDLGLHVSGPGYLYVGTWSKEGEPEWQYHSDFGSFDVNDFDPWNEIDDGLDQIMGVTSTPIKGNDNPTILMRDLFIYNIGSGGPVILDLTLNGQSEYAPYSDWMGVNPFPDPPGWITLTEEDLGDLVIHGGAIVGPSCWDTSAGQCHGDTVGYDLIIDLGDFQAFKAAFGYDYWDDWNGGAGPYNPCADYDRDGYINLGDFQIFKAAFGVGSVPGDCTPGGVWPPP
jgi:hypothetical protein